MFKRQTGSLLINWIESAIATFFNFYIDRFLSTPTAFLPAVIQPVQRTLPTSLIFDFLRDISLEKGSAAVVDLRLYYHNYRQLGESDALCRKSRPWPSSLSGKIHFAERRNTIGHSVIHYSLYYNLISSLAFMRNLANQTPNAGSLIWADWRLK